MKLPIRPIIILLAVVSLTGVSCLKDKAFNNSEIQSVHATGASPKIVEIKLTAASTKNVLNLSYFNSNNDTIVDIIPINLATPGPATQDVHVTLVQKNQLITDYNAANTDTTVTPTNPNPTGVVTDYPVPTKFTVVNPGGVVTIPKGSHTAYLQIKFKPSDFLGTTYALGFTISAITETGYTISGNNQNGIVIINIKNQYDGSYHVHGNRHHPVLGDFPFDYDANLNTTGLTSVDGAVLADLGEGLSITVNPDNTVTLAGDSRTVFPQGGTPPPPNKYDPATKTFTLNYFYNTGAPRLITETLVKNP